MNTGLRQLKVGEQMNIEQPCQGDGGYTLSLTALPDCLALLGVDYLPAGTSGTAPEGEQALSIFRFIAVRAGEGTLAFRRIKPGRGSVLMQTPVTGGRIEVKVEA